MKQLSVCPVRLLQNVKGQILQDAELPPFEHVQHFIGELRVPRRIMSISYLI